jgi:serine/threonine protein kinase
MSSLDQYVGKVLDEKYRLERLLGKGGMGAVYLATHLGTERYVALKLIAPEFMRNDEFVQRFKREARAAGRLRHPNVVDVTDFGFAHAGEEPVAYLIM